MELNLGMLKMKIKCLTINKEPRTSSQVYSPHVSSQDSR
jgi:hypothetical protein